jgi:hypothetical protein
MSESADTAHDEQPRQKPRRRRWPYITAIVIVALLAVIVVVPWVAAGWLAERQLAQMGIENEGTRSLTVDLLNRRIDLGTVEFWSADAERGRIEDFSLRYDMMNLFHGRAVVDRAIVRGIDIRINRAEDGRIQLNGIALDELFGPPEPEADEAAADDDEEGGRGFGFGLDSFLLEDSRAIFTTAGGNELAVEIERLLVEDIRTWQPDRPAIVELVAVINDIELSANAQAHLFSDTIMADAHVRVASIEVEKLERFIGPLGFERRDGEVQANLVTSLQLGADGRVLAGVYGDISQRDAVFVAPGFDFRAANQRVDIDGVVIAQPDSSVGSDNPPVILKAAATTSVTSRMVEANAGDAGSLTYDLIEARLSEVAFMRDQQGRIRLRAEPSIRVMSPKVSGPLAFETDRLDVGFTSLDASLNGASAEVQADGTIRLSNADVTLAAGAEDSAATSIRTGPIETTLGTMAISHAPEQTHVTGQIALEVGELVATAGLPAGEGDVSIGPMDADLSDLDLLVSQEGLGFSGALALTLDEVGLTAPDAQGAATTASLGSIDTRLEDLALALDPAGQPSLSGRLALGLAEIAAEISLVDGTASITAPAFDISLDDVAVEQSDEQMSLAASGRIGLTGLATQVSGPSPSSLSLSSAETSFQGLGVTVAPDGSSDITAPFELALRDIAAELPVGDVSADVALGSLQFAFSQLDVAATPSGTAVQAAGTHRITDVQVTMPQSSALPPMGLELASLDVDLQGFEADAGQDAPRWEAATSIDLASLAARVEGDGRASLSLDSLAVDGLRADDSASVEARSVALAGLDAAFSNSTLAAFAGDGSGESDTQESSSDGASSSIRIGTFSVARPASIRFSDTSFEPPVEVRADFDQLDVSDIDTGDPSQSTTLRVAAIINENAQLALSGWAAIADQQDFDLELDLSNLQLATFSPYAAQAVGLDTESGVFGTKTVATAENGDLNGQVDVEVEDLVLIPASEADAEAASAAIGMPVGAVVGMLEDSEGKIELTFPVSGTVEEPEIGLAKVIREAVVASMAAIFPPTALARMLTSEGSFELQPVPFGAGSAELGDEGRAAADKLVELLQAKPNLEVLLCGRATALDAAPPADGADGDAESDAAQAEAGAQSMASPAPTSNGATDATLVELAQSRASVVQDYLQEEHDLPAERIRECRPRFDPSDDGQPRVDISLT